jgi:hypothetical protein
MFIVDVRYRRLQIGHSVHAPGFLEAKYSARDYCTRHHRGGDELRIARLGRPRYPRGHLAVGVYEKNRSTITPEPCMKAKNSNSPRGPRVTCATMTYLVLRLNIVGKRLDHMRLGLEFQCQMTFDQRA